MTRARLYKEYMQYAICGLAVPCHLKTVMPHERSGFVRDETKKGSKQAKQTAQL